MVVLRRVTHSAWRTAYRLGIELPPGARKVGRPSTHGRWWRTVPETNLHAALAALSARRWAGLTDDAGAEALMRSFGYRRASLIAWAVAKSRTWTHERRHFGRECGRASGRARHHRMLWLRHRAIVMVAKGKTRAEAAALLGVTLRHVRRLLAYRVDPDSAAYRRWRRSLFFSRRGRQRRPSPSLFSQSRGDGDPCLRRRRPFGTVGGLNFAHATLE